MALGPGTRLGPYEIVCLLGAGGMGAVYRAHDAKLNRDVALKVLLPEVADNPERLARFRREAQILASLNHQNIGHIYGLEETDGVVALVLELVEGPTLADRIADGPISLEDALPIAKQIAEALETAHEQGIIHRDLKPANIKVRDDGAVKVLDFGLAKALEPVAASDTQAAAVTHSPTITSPALMTGVGVLLGTAAYMAPEQAKGRPADKRSDIWAFGCVLYEMLTAGRAFKGEDVADTLAAVLRAEPEWTGLPATTPRSVRRLLAGTLAKNRAERIGDLSTVRFALADLAMPVASPEPVLSSHAPGRRGVAMWVMALAAVAGLTSLGWWKSRPQAPARPVMRFTMALGSGLQFSGAGRLLLSVSPDGSQVAYTADGRLYRRSLSEPEAQELAGTGGMAGNIANPIFSPDGQYIAFYSGPERAIKKISVNGGSIVKVAESEQFYGMSWNSEGILIGQGATGIGRLPANGSSIEHLVSINAQEVAHGPQMLPDGHTILFTVTNATGPGRWNLAQGVAQSLTTGQRKVLIEGGTDVHYVKSGHLVYLSSGVLFAAPFDASRVVTLGPAVPVVEGVSGSLGGATGTAQFSVSDDGTLIYVPGATVGAERQFVSLDLQTGQGTPLPIPAGSYESPRWSPDGRRLAFGVDDGKTADVWRWDTSANTAPQRVTFGGRNRHPLWMPDNQRLVFESDRDGNSAIFVQRVDGSALDRLIRAEAPTTFLPESISPDGKVLLYDAISGANTTLWALDLSSRISTRVADVQSEYPTQTEFSPDGRSIAYATREGVQGTVYVRPYPVTDAKYQISTRNEDGHHPLWSPDGKQLYYIPGPGRFAVVDVVARQEFAASAPRYLQRGGITEATGPNIRRNYDISHDGRQLIGVGPASLTGRTAETSPSLSQIRFVINWQEELKQRVPVR